MKINYPLKNIHTLSIDEVLHSFATDRSKGISQQEAIARSKEFGLNIYTAQQKQTTWMLLVHQFKSPIVYILVVGALLSLLYKDFIDAIAIGIVVVVNALIGFFMELQARSSMDALQEMDVITCRVIRDGKTVDIPSENLTPGDIIVFEAGDIIPGDGRLLEANQLQCDESTLTGESLPSVKNSKALPPVTATGDMLNMVFKGTSVMNGKGKAVITGIAHNTELGTITSLVDGAGETETPLDKKINALSRKLIWITLIMTALFAITGFIQGKKWLLIIETTIALAVAAIPEGLPIVSTVALAYGMVLMARRNAIVKKLSSVETLGSTSVILTDKTGTLTENEISIETISFPGMQLQVTIENNQLKSGENKIENNNSLEKIRLTGALCNNAVKKKQHDKKELLGDPIEIALIHLADTGSHTATELQEQYARIAEAPFNSETKMMATLHKSPAGYFVAAKGSVEQLLQTCDRFQSTAAVNTLSPEERKGIIAASETMAAGGLRVLAFAYNEAAEINHEQYTGDLIYIGMIGFLDPPRLDIKPAILSCRKAGIKIVMITGDHPLTALNIARRTGVIDEADKQVITGKDIPPMDSLSQAWKEKILSTSVFARTTPKQKLEIASVYQTAGNIVAMTGDGVNDAPALKKADVGIAMGLRGTQVAKETASIILKDDSFTSIAEAVAYGRTIFQNIQKFVIYLVSCNLSEILIVTVLGFIFPAAVLLPLQILFLNIVTDVFPALALGAGKKNGSVMLKPPRKASKDIISNNDWMVILLYAASLTLSVVLAVYYCKNSMGADSKSINNVAFLTLIFAQLFHVFNMSALHSGLLVNEITRNRFVWLALLICGGIVALAYSVPAMRLVLNLSVLPLKTWIACILISMLPLVLFQLYKCLWKARNWKLRKGAAASIPALAINLLIS